jgi:hypothetical protein
MKTFRDLFIYIDKDKTASFIKLIENCLKEGWVRDTEAEKRSKDFGDDDYYCFSCDRRNDREAAHLAITRKNDNELYVANIVPDSPGRLSYDQYNLILENFYKKFVLPVSEASSVEVKITSNEQNIEDLISKDAFKKLLRFSRSANKSTGSSHPLDRKRWFDFLLTIYGEHGNLHVSDLTRWLIESEKWPEDVAHDLSIEYEFAMGLFDYQAGTR